MKLNRLEWTKGQYGKNFEEDVILNGECIGSVSTELAETVPDLFGWFGEFEHEPIVSSGAFGWSSVHPFYLVNGRGKP